MPGNMYQKHINVMIREGQYIYSQLMLNNIQIGMTGVGVTGSAFDGSGSIDWNSFGRKGAQELGGSGF